MLTDQEKALVEQYNTAQVLLEPFKRILSGWTVEVQHKFQKRLSDVELVASGDLEKDWTVGVHSKDSGVVVAEFAFSEYGRLFDMRQVDYRNRPSPDEAGSLYKWVKSKAEKGEILYSDRARSNGLPFTDPRILHDLTYRIARSAKFKLPRRRWYNKGKEASVADLYTQLQDAMREALKIGLEKSFKKAS